MHLPEHPYRTVMSRLGRPALAALAGPALTAGLALAAAASLGAASASAQTSAHAVVLKNGTVIATRSRPLMALGSVSFLTRGGQVMTMALDQVDLRATRARMATAAPTRPKVVFDDRDLVRARGLVQVVDATPVQPAAAVAAAGENLADTPIVTPDTPIGDPAADLQVPISDREQVGLIRERLSAMETEIARLPAGDRKKTVLVTHQRDLQSELSRLLGRPSSD